MGSWLPGDSEYFSIEYQDFHVSVADDEGETVTVTLDGTVYYGVNVVFGTGTWSYQMVSYSPAPGIEVYVDDGYFDSVTMDLKYSYSYSSVGQEVVGSIQGYVGDQTVNIEYRITVPAS